MVIPDLRTIKRSVAIDIYGRRLIGTVTEPLYYDIGGILIVIPVGFKFNGDSNPFSSNPLAEDKIAFAIIHDYGYQTQFQDRKFWDKMALRILPETADKKTSYQYYIVLRPLGVIAWYTNKYNGLQKFPEAYELRNEYFCNLIKK